MTRRVITALVVLPLLVGAVWVGSPWLTILVAAAALVGWWEFHRMFSPPGRGITPFLAFGALWTVLLVISGQLASQWWDTAVPLLCYATLGGGLLIAFPWLLRFEEGRSLILRARLAAGPVYIGFLLAHALVLRELGEGSDAGRDWLLFALLATFATDTGALFVGHLLGRHSMARAISPGKTWEGAVGGFVSAVGAGLGLGAVLDLSLAETAWLACVVGVVAQMGDLAESRMKRVAGVKDTGVIFPGHGGALDRLDSLLFTVPVLYYLVVLVVKP